MISSLQFLDTSNITLTISEVNENDKIDVSIGDTEDRQFGGLISLGEDEVRKLSEWLNEAVKLFDSYKSEAP